MIENSKIKKGPPKHNPVCYQTLQDIVIPAGTILRSQVNDTFGCGINGAQFEIAGTLADMSPYYKKVIA